MEANIRNATRELEAYQISDLVVDVARQRVTRTAVDIALPKLSFDLLLVLIRASPSVVSNDELMTRVWSGLVVSPETVSQRVKLLRDALGDDPRAPRYIAGLRGRGYRLLPEVRQIEREPDAHPAESDPVPSEYSATVSLRPSRATRRLGTKTILGIVAGVALVAIAALIVIALRPQPLASPAANKVTVVGLPPRTVAVLPFENLSGDPANEYLALGMAEMVLNRLANVSGITVIARSSSFTFRDVDADARVIGGKLGARYLVEGSVQREGEKLRVTANLIDAESGSQLEAVRFDRMIGDIFGIQDQIADKVAAALESRLANVVMTGQGTARSGNLDAWLTYLQGRALLEQWSLDGSEQAEKLFERAVALDPKFAAAYVGLVDARMQAAARNGELPPDGEAPAPLVATLAPLIDKAIALDPSLGAAYLVRASWLEQDLARIEADYRKGIELDPVNSRGLLAFSEFLLDAGAEEARSVLDRALLVDPLSARGHYLKALDYTDSQSAFEQALLHVLSIDPKFTSALAHLAQIRWRSGELAQGVNILERAIAIDPGSPWIRNFAYLMYVDTGDLAAARDVSEPYAARFGNTRFEMLQYAGDWRGAGDAAYRVYDPGPANCNDSAAIRDHALMTRDYRRAIRFIESNLYLGEPRQLTMRSATRAVPLAHLLRDSGQPAASAKLLEELLAWLERKDWKPAWEPGPRRIRANVLALQGHRDAALRELAEAFRSGDRRLWWYTIERDPLWEDMRSDPRFQAIAAEARAHAAGQRARIEEMRRKGDVPLRLGGSDARASSVAPVPPSDAR